MRVAREDWDVGQIAGVVSYRAEVLLLLLKDLLGSLLLKHEVIVPVVLVTLHGSLLV